MLGILVQPVWSRNKKWWWVFAIQPLSPGKEVEVFNVSKTIKMSCINKCKILVNMYEFCWGYRSSKFPNELIWNMEFLDHMMLTSETTAHYNLKLISVWIRTTKSPLKLVHLLWFYIWLCDTKKTVNIKRKKRTFCFGCICRRTMNFHKLIFIIGIWKNHSFLKLYTFCILTFCGASTEGSFV